MSLRTRTRAALVAVAGVAALAGCSARARDTSRNPPVGQIITAEQIRRTGAATAWEALKFTVRSHEFRDYRGEPQRIYSNRGVGSMVLREEPLIHLDGARLTDIQVLRHMPANTILYVQVLNGTDGTTYYGTSATAGVILIETTLGVDLEEIGKDSLPPDTAAARVRLGRNRLD